MNRLVRAGLACGCLLVWLPRLVYAEELGTAFTYQGQLKEGGVPANNWYDLRFRLFDAMTDGTQIGFTNEYEMLTINNGLFAVRLYFGAEAYKGDARWLEIGIRSGDGTEPYTVLSPRQELTPAPYALALPAMRARQSDISPSVIGGWQNNDVTEGVLGATVGGGGSADVDGSPKPNVITDNYGTVSGGTGNQAGNDDTTLDNASNATIGGGYANSASAGNATVAGGWYNRATASRTTVAGGWNNVASGDAAAVGGGKDNVAGSSYNTIAGGQGNSTSYGRTTIGGGQGNAAAGDSSTIGGGRENTTDGIAATIPGGWQNSALGNYSFAAGRRAKAEDAGAFVWADSTDADFQSTGSNQFLIRASGGVGIGTPDPAAELDVAGTVKMTGFKLSTGAASGRVLACDSSGTGSWQPDSVSLPFDGSVWSDDWALKAANTHFSSGIIYGALAKSKKGVRGYVNLDDGEIGGIGVEGEAYSDTAGVGVKGEATGAWAKGVYGYAHGGGQSIGVHGQSNDPQGIGVYAIGVGDTAIGIKAQGGMWGYAAVLEGATSTHELEITGGSDVSERFDVRTRQEGLAPIPGMVVSIDPKHPGDLIVSSRAYDRRVAGVISGAGGVKPGMVMGQTGSIADGEHPVALSGRVYVWADASIRVIRPGDLLTTSDIPGHAMCVTRHDKAHGAILGKAMTSLDGGRGLVLVLVNLQ